MNCTNEYFVPTQCHINQLIHDLVVASIVNVNKLNVRCTYHVSVGVSSNSLTYVTRLNCTTGRFNSSWTALKETKVIHYFSRYWMTNG